MAKGLALDLAPSGITVNVVAPGWFDSPLAERWKQNPARGSGGARHTANGGGAAADLAGAYQFLASEASAFVTGTVLHVDGGYLLHDGRRHHRRGRDARRRALSAHFAGQPDTDSC